MNHFTLPRRAAWMALFALGTLAVLAGCSKRVTSVDAGYTTLEGRLNANARMLAWRDAPVQYVIWADLGPVGPDDPSADIQYDTLYGFGRVSWGDPGVIRTALLDKTAASGFQFFRRAAGGGLEALADFAVQPSTKWLSTGWEMYWLNDQHPSGYSPATYTGRGLLDGNVTTSSPVTNDAIADGPAPTPSITFSWRYSPADSSIRYSWSSTPGAAGYWLDIYQFKNSATELEIFASGAPNPVMVGNLKHTVLKYVPAAAATPSGVGPMSTRLIAGPGGADSPEPNVVTAPTRGPMNVLALPGPHAAGAPGLSELTASMMGPVTAQALAGPRGTGSQGPLGAQALTGPLNAGALGVDVLTESPFIRSQIYFARVTAVDAHGNVLAWMTGDYAFLQGNGYYYYIPVGASIIAVPGK